MLRAIKVIPKDDCINQSKMQEANLLKNLKHSCIPIIYDIEEDEYNIYIIEEYADGKTITEFMKDNRLSEALICKIIIQLCEVLSYMHNTKGVYHLDLKPDNIIVNNNYYIKLIDYGNALYEGQEREKCVGTKGFAPPEQYYLTSLNNRADIYNVGMLLLYMFTNGHILSGINKIRQKQIKQIVKKCVRHNIWQRYNNIDEVKRDLTNIVNNKITTKDVQTKPLVINITGCKSGIGVTHFALALSKHLNLWGIKTLCCSTDTAKQADCYINIVRGEAADYTGIYKKNGTYLLPNFNNYVKYNAAVLNEYQVIINDTGVYNTGIYNADSDSKLILIGGGKYYEREDMLKCINLINDDKLICVFNHISGNEFYNYVRHNESVHKVYRMPYVYDWSGSSEIFSCMLKDIIQDNFAQLSLFDEITQPKQKLKLCLRRRGIYNNIKDRKKLYRKKQKSRHEI